jgi:hypothetical protein
VKRGVRRAALAAVVAGIAGIGVAGCGKKGPPLPPLVKLPVAPTGVAARRRATTVDVTLTMPAANTDGTRPANIARVDVYAITGPANGTDDVLIKYATKIGSVAVKTPRDPNQTVDVDDPDSDIEPPGGRGLDQGATTHILEKGTPGTWSAIKPSIPPPVPARSSAPPAVVPLVGPPLAPPVRQFFAAGFNNRGRRGPLSTRVAIPVIDAPATPPDVHVTYDESTITVAWNSVSAPAAIDDGRLPSRSLVGMRTTNGYNVYKVDVSPGGDPVEGVKETKLTSVPLDDLPFRDGPFEWGAARCYVVRAVTSVAGLTVESEGRPSVCVTPVDTFPPAAPKQPTAIALIGGINLLWDANEEKDLAGYIVLRAPPGAPLTPLTPVPIDATNFTDAVPTGTSWVYALEAVDRAGNVSPMSPPSDEERAR